MDSSKPIYATFPFEWTVKYTSCQIQYRKAFNINQIDEIFCSIINAKANEINVSELGSLLGFNLQDLAEIDILNIYLKGLTEYNLIVISNETIQLTAFGQESLQSKLKYKYFFSTTKLFENQTATGEKFDFSFENVFDLENGFSHENKIEKPTIENTELKQKLQFQIFGNDIYKGEIIELYESNLNVNYKSIFLQCEITALEDSFQLSIYNSNLNKPDLQFLIDLPENEELKSKLIRKGMYHHILSEKHSITVQDIEMYIDLWNWKELAGNLKIDWDDKTIYKLFLENGDGSIWSVISEKAPIESIKLVIIEYAEYWNWTTLTERFDNGFIKEQIEKFNWDFEELSYKETELVLSLLSIPTLKDRDWDWNYLSINLPDEFIENNIDDFSWDYCSITTKKNQVLDTLLKRKSEVPSEYIKILISKPWDWKFISKRLKINILYNHIQIFSQYVDWSIVLMRFFNNAEITAKCLQEESFKPLLKHYLPDNFVVAHQKYFWTSNLIDFFEQQNLIQWESKSYINGFDTNVNVEWDKTIFQKYHSRITTEKGFLNVSQQILDYSLIEGFPDFTWNWEGISQNKNLLNKNAFIERAFVGEFPFSNNLLWDEILLKSTFDVAFWNKNLVAFYTTTDSEKQSLFWKSLTQKENQDYIFVNPQFPWDWSFITENSTQDAILDSFEDEQLLKKWDWKIATRKIDKAIILENLEDFAPYINWKFLIIEVFTIDNELSKDKLLPRIAKCLSVVNSDKRKDIWKDITAKYPFSILFPIVEATYQSDFFEWDWDFISNQNHFPTDIGTLKKYCQSINWSSFSDSQSIKRKFEFKKEEWTNFSEYSKYTIKYLKSFQNYWNWDVLTKNSNLHYNREIIKLFLSKWDWQYLSEYGGFLIQKKKDKENYLSELLSDFSLIEFEILSKREDINIDSGLVFATKDKNWDWKVLSENEKIEISNDLILELKDKNWNWKAISKRANLTYDNETLLQLLDKDWDWNYLSQNKNLEFNADFIEKTKLKSWNWELISRHKSFLPTVDILTLTKDFDLDWEHISQHSALNPTKELLAKFETKWNWQIITENRQINFDDIDFIERFAYNWNWRFICEEGKLTLNSQILTKFKEFLKWDLISANTNANFTKEIIQEFKQYWYWTALKENKQVEELLGSYVSDEIAKSSTLTFIDKIEQQWSQWRGSIYHFSHIDNAVEIIKNRKIQSRNKAKIKGDAAGNVVHRRGDAHEYARFYFRPHTPTQFYNEFLGKNLLDKNYNKARNLGFPKCPIPIFFRFSLKDVLFKNEKKCCVSNGNMQKRTTQFNPIGQMIAKFNFEHLYSEIWNGLEDYMNYSQQEFLVKDELSFDDLTDFEIVCPSNSDRTLLINLLGQDCKDIFSKITVDSSYYNNENPRIKIEEEESELHIKSEFNGQGYFVLNASSNINEIEILSGNVSKIEKSKIIFNSNISIRNVKQDIQLNFIDESNRNWFVYSK